MTVTNSIDTVGTGDSSIAGHTVQSSVKAGSTKLLLTAAPNPFKNSVQLAVISPVYAKAMIFITDVMGRKVFKQDVLLNQGTNIIPVTSNGWRTGTYFVQVGTNSETQGCKIIKE